jgi:hypothetical protein
LDINFYDPSVGTRNTTKALSADQIRLNAPNAYTDNLIQVVSGTINGDSGLNIGLKLPISFTTNKNININCTTFSCYDVELTKKYLMLIIICQQLFLSQIIQYKEQQQQQHQQIQHPLSTTSTAFDKRSFTLDKMQ